MTAVTGVDRGVTAEQGQLQQGLGLIDSWGKVEFWQLQQGVRSDKVK